MQETEATEAEERRLAEAGGVTAIDRLVRAPATCTSSLTN